MKNFVKILLALMLLICINSCMFTNQLWKDMKSEAHIETHFGYFFDRENDKRVIFIGKSYLKETNNNDLRYYYVDDGELVRLLKILPKFNPKIVPSFKFGMVFGRGSGRVSISSKDLSKEDAKFLRENGFRVDGNYLFGSYVINRVTRYHPSDEKIEHEKIYEVKNSDLFVKDSKLINNTLRVLLTPLSIAADTVVIIVGTPIFIGVCAVDRHCMR